jgi:hypothetical protein
LNVFPIHINHKEIKDLVKTCKNTFKDKNIDHPNISLSEYLMFIRLLSCHVSNKSNKAMEKGEIEGCPCSDFDTYPISSTIKYIDLHKSFVKHVKQKVKLGYGLGLVVLKPGKKCHNIELDCDYSELRIKPKGILKNSSSIHYIRNTSLTKKSIEHRHTQSTNSKTKFLTKKVRQVLNASTISSKRNSMPNEPDYINKTYDKSNLQKLNTYSLRKNKKKLKNYLEVEVNREKGCSSVLQTLDNRRSNSKLPRYLTMTDNTLVNEQDELDFTATETIDSKSNRRLRKHRDRRNLSQVKSSLNFESSHNCSYSNDMGTHNDLSTINIPNESVGYPNIDKVHYNISDSMNYRGSNNKSFGFRVNKNLKKMGTMIKNVKKNKVCRNSSLKLRVHIKKRSYRMSKETSFEKMQDDFEERNSGEINIDMRDITTPNIDKPRLNPYMYQSMKKLEFLR